MGVCCSVLAVQPWYKERVRVSEGAASASWSVIRVARQPGAGICGRFLYWHCEIVCRRLHRAKTDTYLACAAALPCGELPDCWGGNWASRSWSRCMAGCYFYRASRGIAGGILCEWMPTRLSRSSARDLHQRRGAQAGLDAHPGVAKYEVVYNGVNTTVFPQCNPGRIQIR